MKKAPNLLNKKFGRLIVIERAKTDKTYRPFWNCLCSCGKCVRVLSYSLLNGSTKSCGCLHKECAAKQGRSTLNNLVGQKFHKLTVTALHDIGVSGANWVVRCDCGNIKTVAGRHLINNAIRSCGCLKNRSVSMSELTFGTAIETTFNIELKHSFSLKDRMFDYKVPDKNILIELDGDHWHSTYKQKKNDQYKNELAEKHGYKLLRFRLNSVKEVPELINREYKKLAEVLTIAPELSKI